MARVTRSRKIEIAEDPISIALETPLPNTPAGQLPLNDISSDIGENNMPTEDTSVPSQLRQLKAAYRNAIGAGKKGKKSKNKKKDQVDVEQQENIGDGHAAMNDENAEFEAVHQLDTLAHEDLAQSYTPTTPNATSNLVPELQTRAVRMTRHQLALQQAGQYISTHFVTSDQYFTDHHLYKDTPFINDVGGFPTDTFRNSKLHLPNSDDGFNHTKEELAKSMSETTTEISYGQIPEPVVDEQDIQDFETPKKEILQTPVNSVRRTLEEVERTCEKEQVQTRDNSDEEDSFVRQITSRTPAKPTSRIEDSLEALDQFEEQMDAISQAALAEGMSVEKAKRTPSKTGESMGPQEGPPTSNRQSNPPKQTPSKYGSMRVKPTTVKPSPSVKKTSSMVFKKPVDEQKAQSSVKTAGRRPLSVFETVKSTKPLTRSNFELPGEAVARKLKEQREARLSQRESSEEVLHRSKPVSGLKTTKSTKPPTRPTFELPGEALSRRKKEAQEARLRAEEEEQRKRREFKARPVRKSIVPDFVPRETIASRARQSKVGLENMDDELSVLKRDSVGAHRPSLHQVSIANTSAPRAPGSNPQPIVRKSSTTSGPSMSGLYIERNFSDKDVQVQRQRAREIYNRDAKLIEEQEKEKQEREAAAKRAREEAAERGRQASREWAEKQRARKMAEGDKGMSTGYGPGGQLGLRG
ncbi:hypothetical protein HYALB_00005874 [Hymenoscyphus albidus]|uniref:Uncharacterized protein n=1 Tax=Hymenoscyphus albidus TaxID=595503 RepID=A0A9N9LZ71_9HELO|nr:hypothetical protein HYALB_00005874 [Hymenoscyphus albidus]